VDRAAARRVVDVRHSAEIRLRPNGLAGTRRPLQQEGSGVTRAMAPEDGKTINVRIPVTFEK